MPDKQPKVSIIMCAYNVEAYIERAIKAIQAQTYTNWELIISDDASTDATVAVVAPFLEDQRISLHKHKLNVGYIRNKNRAFQLANGELLTQLDADDTCGPNRIEQQVNIFQKYENIKICGTNYQLIDLEDKAKPYQKYGQDALIEFSVPSYPFWFPGLMFRRELLAEFGLFSAYFDGIYGDDHYWTMRVNQRYPIYFIKDVLYNYRINPTSLTNVFDNPRKLIVEEILAELKRQRLQHKTDWVEKGELDKMRAFEKSLFDNKSFMSEKYRIWAAKAIDKKRWTEAASLLKTTFFKNPLNRAFYRSLLYYFRKRLAQ
jgi:glycosyltransferase involved in cell wall biosynthesis